MARHKPCFTAIKSGGIGVAPPEMRSDHPGHHRTAQTRYALLRKTWLPPLRKDFGFFRHAFVRILQTIGARRHSRLLTIFLLFSFSPSTHPRNPKIPLQYPRTSLRRRGDPAMNFATTIRKSIVANFVLAFFLLPTLTPA